MTETRLRVAAPVLLLAAACVHQGAPSRTGAQTPAPTMQSAPDAARPSPPAAASTLAPPAPAAPSTLPQQSTPAGGARQSPSAERTAAPSRAPSSAAARPLNSARGAPAPAAAAHAPTLDLAGLEQRLRDTSAIGVFTKLSLKNQVDDLLAQFRAYHQGAARVTLAQLRQKYEVLLMKVITLLQDDDPSLATAVSSSREAIWNVLTDPKKFANI